MSTDLLVAQTQLATQLIVDPSGVSGNQIAYRFETMPGNQPSAYQNKVWLWQTSQQTIPINSPPFATQGVSVNQPDGSNVFQGLSVGTDSYLVAYGVGPSVANIVASV